MDAAFGCVKQTLRKSTERAGGSNKNNETPSGGFEDVDGILRILSSHQLFNENYAEREHKRPDSKGFTLIERNIRDFGPIVIENKFRKLYNFV